MCGIAGIVNQTGDATGMLTALRRMSAAMIGRGPDGEGYLLAYTDARPAESFRGPDTPARDDHAPPGFPQRHLDDADVSAAVLGLAHRRLAIVDLSIAGHQPMTDPDRRYWLIYNGEIYNAAELRDDLQEGGAVFVGHSDTEVLLHGLVRWGPQAVERLDGMFAFALWDDREKTLLLCRDRLGIKPLYFAIADRRWIFGSDIKTLLASGRVAARADHAAIAMTLMFGVTPRPRTAFAGVTALRPGHWMKISPDGSTTEHRYWRVPTGCQQRDLPRPAAVAAVRETLEASVRRRLVADVPVGTLMSGGIDSTTVSALAARHHPDIHAFTLAFDDAPGMSETDEARATAAMHPLRHVVCVAKPEAALQHLDQIVSLYEEPAPAISANWMIHREISRHDIKVILNGLGGDELFGGYTRYRLARWWRLLRLLRPMLRCAGPLDPRAARLAAIGGARDAAELYSTLAGVIPAPLRERMVEALDANPRTMPEALAELYLDGETEFGDACEAVSYFDLVHYIGNHHLYRVDQFSMAFSLEARVPMLDHALVELAMRVPTAHKVRGRGKLVLREVARELIHPDCLAMRKRGFGLPTGTWLAGPLRPVAEEKLRDLRQRGVIDPALIRGLWDDFLAGRVRYPAVWWMVALEMWFERFIDEATER